MKRFLDGDLVAALAGESTDGTQAIIGPVTCCAHDRAQCRDALAARADQRIDRVEDDAKAGLVVRKVDQNDSVAHPVEVEPSRHLRRRWPKRSQPGGDLLAA